MRESEHNPPFDLRFAPLIVDYLLAHPKPEPPPPAPRLRP
jgi:hypothetical protein